MKGKVKGHMLDYEDEERLLFCDVSIHFFGYQHLVRQSNSKKRQKQTCISLTI